jgi:dihydroorotate dehydrogenase (NAD+) catalytic subunit
MPKVDLSTEVSGLRLKNPLVLASGILDLNAGLLRKVGSCGAGAVTTKSIGLKPRKGNRNPTVAAVEGGILNSMGLCNPGIEGFRLELCELKGIGIPVVGSVYASSPGEFAKVASLMAECNVSAVELNVSCPNVAGECVGQPMGQDPQLVSEVVRKVKSKVKKPIFVKLTPNVNDIAEIARAAEKAGADAITAVNTFGPGLAIDVDSCTPILGGTFGGMSGPAVKPLALACVYKTYEAVKIPVIGCGGVGCGRDAAEYLMAGASAVGVGTAVYYQGLGVFGRINRELTMFMKKRGYSKASELIGLAHRR